MSFNELMLQTYSSLLVFNKATKAALLLAQLIQSVAFNEHTYIAMTNCLFYL